MSFGAEFLTVPDLFPARDSGEAWGEHPLAVSFAGGPYLFRGLSKAQAELLGQRYEELLVSPPAPEECVEIRVFQVAESDFRPLPPVIGRPYSMDLDFRPDLVTVAAPHLMGRLTLGTADEARPAGSRAALWTSVEQPLDQVIGVFENFFRLLVAYRLNALGGALLHSAAAVRDSRAFLFLGKSGAGKSTISRINQAAGLEVLSDDMNALVRIGDQVVVEKLPFAGDLGQTGARKGGVRLAGLFRLEQASEHAVLPLSEPEALALLLSCAPYLNADPYRTDRLMENLADMVRGGTIVKRLAFRRDASFWNLIEAEE